MPQLPLKSQLIERASRAAADGQWHVASVLYDALEAIEMDDMIHDTGRAAWPAGSCARCGRTDCEHIPAMVPLIRPPMRNETPAPAAQPSFCIDHGPGCSGWPAHRDA